MRRLLLLLALAATLCGSALAEPFNPQVTVNVAVTGTAQSLTPSVGFFSAGRKAQLVLTNVGTQTIFLRTDGTTATVSNGMPMLANSQFVLSVDSVATAISVIAATTGSTLYVTTGAGE